MPAMEPLCQIVGININNLSIEESYIVEMEFLVRICEELKGIIKLIYKDYFRLIKCNEEMESAMLDANLIRHLINDILSTEEYSIEGIACYAQTTEDVICDVVAGQNPLPSLFLSLKLIELHRSVRPSLYSEIMKKITTEYLVQN